MATRRCANCGSRDVASGLDLLHCISCGRNTRTDGSLMSEDEQYLSSDAFDAQEKIRLAKVESDLIKAKERIKELEGTA
jgi:hypothetical protein